MWKAHLAGREGTSTFPKAPAVTTNIADVFSRRKGNPTETLTELPQPNLTPTVKVTPGSTVVYAPPPPASRPSPSFL